MPKITLLPNSGNCRLRNPKEYLANYSVPFIACSFLWGDKHGVL